MLKLIHCVSVTAHPLSVSQPIHCQCYGPSIVSVTAHPLSVLRPIHCQCHGPSIVSVTAHPLSVLRPIHCQCYGPSTVSDTVLESVLESSATVHPMSDRAIGSSVPRSIRCQCSSPVLQFIKCRIGQPIHRIVSATNCSLWGRARDVCYPSLYCRRLTFLRESETTLDQKISPLEV